MLDRMPRPPADRRYATYLQIADTLAQRIARRRPGAPVESEHELAELFGVNRLTARAALDELERRFLVRRSKGRGTFVARRIDYVIGPERTPSFTATVRAAGAVPRTENSALRLVRPPAWARRELALPEGDRAYVMHRRSWVDGLLASAGTSYLRPAAVPDLERRMPHEGSLYELLVSVYDIEPIRAWSRCQTELATDGVAEELGLTGREQVFGLRGRLDGRFPGGEVGTVETTVGHFRLDVFNIIYEYGSPMREEAP